MARHPPPPKFLAKVKFQYTYLLTVNPPLWYKYRASQNMHWTFKSSIKIANLYNMVSLDREVIHHFVFIIIYLFHAFSAGFFIFLSFAVSGRALELYKSKLTAILKNLTTKRVIKGNSSNCSAQSTRNDDEGQNTQDTSL